MRRRKKPSDFGSKCTSESQLECLACNVSATYCFLGFPSRPLVLEPKSEDCAWRDNVLIYIMLELCKP